MKKLLVMMMMMACSLGLLAQKKPVKTKADTTKLITVSGPSRSVNTDSIPTISVLDILKFYEVLSKGVSYSDYKTLTPESTLQQLIIWDQSRRKKEEPKP